jgi:hypothetical protein
LEPQEIVNWVDEMLRGVEALAGGEFSVPRHDLARWIVLWLVGAEEDEGGEVILHPGKQPEVP